MIFLSLAACMFLVVQNYYLGQKLAKISGLAKDLLREIEPFFEGCHSYRKLRLVVNNEVRK